MAVPLSAVARPATRIRRKREEEADPESLLRKVGGGALSGLAAAGNFLDIPGSMVRDVLGGENPFDQFLSPLSPENRVSGRDLLERGGLLQKNTPGLDWGDVGGFLGEIALDPLTYLGGVGLLKGASKGGHILSKAGLKLPGRVARMTTTVRQAAEPLLKTAPDALEAAAKGSGYADVAEFLSRHGDEPVGGLASLNVPFGGPIKALGTGPLAQKVGRWLDVAGEFLRWGKIPGTDFSPGAQLGALFERGIMGATSKLEADVTRRATGAAEQGVEAAREALYPHVVAWHQKLAGQPVQEMVRMNGLLRDALEIQDSAQRAAHLSQAGLDDAAPMVDQLRNLLDTMPAREVDKGVMSRMLDDLFAEYAPREKFMFDNDVSRSAFPARILTSKHPSQIARAQHLRDLSGRTALINKLSVDPDLVGVTHRTPPGQLTKAFWDNQEQILQQKMTALGHPNWLFENTRELTRWLGDLDPRHVSENIPAFPHDPVQEILRRAEYGARGEAMADTMVDVLADTARLIDDAPVKARPLREVVDNTGMLSDRIIERIAAQRGIDVAEAAKLHVPEEAAAGIMRLRKSFQSPDEINAFFRGIQKFTDLFRAGATAFPAFHNRNLIGGQIQNKLLGAFSWRSLRQSSRLYHGQPLHGIAKELANDPRFAGKTDAEVASLLSKEAWKNNVAPRGQGVGLEGELAKSSLERSVAPDIPGVAPLGKTPLGTFASSLKSAIPRSLEEANPFSAANFAPFQGSRNWGHFVESLNRLEPWIDLVKQGYSFKEAADRVRLSHVDYGALTQFERKLRGLFPFYSFARGQAEFLMKELAERPGGRFGQTIRAINQGRTDEPVPEYIAQTAALPLGTLPSGADRFVTGLGLMPEDPLSIPQFTEGGLDLGGTAAELISRMNPLAKLPIELAAGESFFQRGPFGGRELSDMDPTLGRLLTNVGLRDELPSGQARPLFGTTFENIAANLPTNRLATTARVLTDPRKYEGPVPGLGAAANVLTGVSVADVSPGARDAIMRESLQHLASSLGARTYRDVRFTKAMIEQTEKDDPELAQQMRAINSAQNMLAIRAKIRKREASKTPR